MWKELGIMSRRMLVAVLLAGSLGTAAFAFNATVYAKASGCCLLIAECFGNECSGDTCEGGNFCCDDCVP
jgi:hypothetical protein